MIKKRILGLLCLSGMALQLIAAESAAPAAPPAASDSASANTETAAPASSTTSDLEQLRQRIAKQEEQIKLLQQSVEEQRTLLDGALQKANAAAFTANASSVASSGQVKLLPVVNVARPNVSPSGRAAQDVEKPSPLSISIGNTTFTPLGFVDFTFVGRSTNVGSGIGTGFNGIPYNNSTAGRISENNFSTQNSRIGFRVDSKFLGAKVLGYFEADFLGNQPTNVFVTSNANTFRMRNVFVDVQKGGVEVLGGQDWSFFTPNRKGLSPLPSDIFFTINMDTNYQVGLPWARQSQFRLVAHPTEDIAFGISLENPQQYTGSAVVFPSALAAGLANEFNGTTATTGINYSVPNLHPDIIFKAAYDAHVGKKILHVEAGALVRSFKDVLPSTYTTATVTAGTGEINANLEVAKGVRIIANTFFGSGGGRYIQGQGPDLVVRSDGSISPVHTYSTVDGFEAQVTKNTQISMLYSGVYFKKDVFTDTTGKTPVLAGYGFAGSPASNNRNIQEATFDIVRTLWKNPNYGALALIGQYSYVWRDPWSISNGERNARTNMYFLDLRYTLP